MMSDYKVNRKLARQEMPVFAGRGAGFHSCPGYERPRQANWLPEDEEDEWVDIWERPAE